MPEQQTFVVSTWADAEVTKAEPQLEDDVQEAEQATPENETEGEQQ